jgi:heme A synthase
MVDREPKLPRTPLRVALITFGIVCLVGLVGSVVVMSATGVLGDHPYARGQQLGQGVGTFAVVCAVVAYLAQRNRLGKP